MSAPTVPQPLMEGTLYYRLRDRTVAIRREELVIHKNRLYYFRPNGTSCYLYSDLTKMQQLSEKVASPAKQNVRAVILFFKPEEWDTDPNTFADVNINDSESLRTVFKTIMTKYCTMTGFAKAAFIDTLEFARWVRGEISESLVSQKTVCDAITHGIPIKRLDNIMIPQEVAYSIDATEFHDNIIVSHLFHQNQKEEEEEEKTVAVVGAPNYQIVNQNIVINLNGNNNKVKLTHANKNEIKNNNNKNNNNNARGIRKEIKHDSSNNEFNKSSENDEEEDTERRIKKEKTKSGMVVDIDSYTLNYLRATLKLGEPDSTENLRVENVMEKCKRNKNLRFIVFVDHDNCPQALQGLESYGFSNMLFIIFMAPQTKRSLHLNEFFKVHEENTLIIQSKQRVKNAVDMSISMMCMELHYKMQEEMEAEAASQIDFIIATSDSFALEVQQRMLDRQRYCHIIDGNNEKIVSWLYKYNFVAVNIFEREILSDEQVSFRGCTAAECEMDEPVHALMNQVVEFLSKAERIGKWITVAELSRMIPWEKRKDFMGYTKILRRYARFFQVDFIENTAGKAEVRVAPTQFVVKVEIDDPSLLTNMAQLILRPLQENRFVYKRTKYLEPFPCEVKMTQRRGVPIVKVYPVVMTEANANKVEQFFLKFIEWFKNSGLKYDDIVKVGEILEKMKVKLEYLEPLPQPGL